MFNDVSIMRNCAKTVRPLLQFEFFCVPMTGGNAVSMYFFFFLPSCGFYLLITRQQIILIGMCLQIILWGCLMCHCKSLSFPLIGHVFGTSTPHPVSIALGVHSVHFAMPAVPLYKERKVKGEEERRAKREHLSFWGKSILGFATRDVS